MLSDDIVVEDGATDITLTRVLDPTAKPTQTVRRSADELYVLRIDQTTTGANRRRHSVNYTQRKPTEDATLAGNVPSQSITITIDRPIDGFTSTETERLIAHAVNIVTAYDSDLIAGEG
jgi:hypothetical protein